jgi:pimeloyl-ACP methyl ester carboxylesterase
MSDRFASTESLIGSLREIRFTIEVADETVPGLVYLPTETEAPMPLVLIQHPGTSSKDDYFVADVAKMWAPRGWVCAGIDAPLHGDRRGHDPMSLFRDPSRFPEIVAQFANELSVTIDALSLRLPIDPARLGYVGYSMGSMLGVPAVAIDGRFRAAAFCLVGEGGMVGPASGSGSYVPRLESVAVRIVGKKSDELIGRAATEALYEALPGEKDIVWLSGGHFQIGPDVVDAAGNWLKSHL